MRSLNYLFVFYVFFVLFSAPVSAEPLSPVTLFAKGCISNGGNLENWARSRPDLSQARIDKPEEFAQSWRNLDYPVSSRLLNMWRMNDEPVWLYQHTNNGCTVVTYNAFDEQAVETFLKSVFKSATKRSDIEAVLRVKEGEATYSDAIEGVVENEKSDKKIPYAGWRSLENLEFDDEEAAESISEQLSEVSPAAGGPYQAILRFSGKNTDINVYFIVKSDSYDDLLNLPGKTVFHYLKTREDLQFD